LLKKNPTKIMFVSIFYSQLDRLKVFRLYLILADLRGHIGTHKIVCFLHLSSLDIFKKAIDCIL
jgi:hypothetical protein